MRCRASALSRALGRQRTGTCAPGSGDGRAYVYIDCTRAYEKTKSLQLSGDVQDVIGERRAHRFAQEVAQDRAE